MDLQVSYQKLDLLFTLVGSGWEFVNPIETYAPCHVFLYELLPVFNL